MHSSKKPFRALRKAIKAPFNRLKVKVKEKLGWLSTPLIQPYLGFGTSTTLVIKGRVIENYGIALPTKTDSTWQNFLSMTKRYASVGLPDERVIVYFRGQMVETTTDGEGYFETTIDLSEPLTTIEGNRWYTVEISMPFYQRLGKKTDIRTSAEILVVDESSRFGIISDIDDTFLVSYSTDFFRKISLMALRNAHTRLPFDGVAAFYQALSRPEEGQCSCPLFYVSSSEWNIYDLLNEFCRYHKIPKGPFLLRDMEDHVLAFWKNRRVNHFHKYDKIVSLLEMYESIKFILIGDSGQKDPEIYSRIVGNYPDRIMAIYIRDVGNKKKNAKVKRIAMQINELHRVPMLLVRDTVQAARHALLSHYIDHQDFRRVVVDKIDNKELPGEMEELLHVSGERSGMIRRK